MALFRLPPANSMLSWPRHPLFHLCLQLAALCWPAAQQHTTCLVSLCICSGNASLTIAFFMPV